MISYRYKNLHSKLIIEILKGSSAVMCSQDLIKRLNSKLEKEEDIIKNGGDLRTIINWIRSEQKAPILSNSKGYWYSTDKKEIAATVVSLKLRGKSIIKAAEGLQNFI